MNLPQTILASSAQSLRCWSVPSAGCFLAQLVSEGTVIANRIKLAKKQTFDSLLGVISLPDVARVESRDQERIIQSGRARNGRFPAAVPGRAGIAEAG
jgi:hypothetical protein